MVSLVTNASSQIQRVAGPRGARAAGGGRGGDDTGWIETITPAACMDYFCREIFPSVRVSSCKERSITLYLDPGMLCYFGVSVRMAGLSRGFNDVPPCRTLIL